MEKKYETWCPLFSGFYNTIWEMNDEQEEIDYHNEEHGTEFGYDDWECDYRRYMIDTSKAFVAKMAEMLSSVLPAITGLVYQELRSPREHNFSTDVINIEVIENGGLGDQLRAYVGERAEAWAEYLRDRYTSCSGFMSSYSNDVDTWSEYVSDFTDLYPEDRRCSGHYLGSILQFVCEQEEWDELDDFYYEVSEGIYAFEYMTLKEKEEA